MITEKTKTDLFMTAKNMLDFSYAPYSHFHVGAALLSKDGKIYTGCNIENAAYGPSNCAERTAFFKAVSEGVKQFDAIMIVGGPNGQIKDYCPPCGVCRQVMMEFCNPDEFKILLAKSEDDIVEYTLKELLPLGFGNADLQK
ncbi:MAG: cytidine deaminase [Treponema sp.]|uniref:cytidine deaminase n=1 Tax=Treponema sp. TaxID=166 RepID=UPI00298DB0C9|nr:cytidine deaminase [Treponema sp.]MCQ2599768.1 cytidine deaminase [Treponema sp.]